MKDIEKIYKVLEIKKIPPTKAERLLGLSQGTLTKSYERRGNVHDSTREKFTRYFGVTSLWWETQKGEMFEKTLPVFEDQPTQYGKPAVDLIELITGFRNEILELQKERDDLKEKLKRYEGGK